MRTKNSWKHGERMFLCSVDDVTRSLGLVWSGCGVVLLAAGRLDLDGDLLWTWSLGVVGRFTVFRLEGDGGSSLGRHLDVGLGASWGRDTDTVVGDGLKTTLHWPGSRAVLKSSMRFAIRKDGGSHLTAEEKVSAEAAETRLT
jgi:hypothetical protein